MHGLGAGLAEPADEGLVLSARNLGPRHREVWPPGGRKDLSVLAVPWRASAWPCEPTERFQPGPPPVRWWRVVVRPAGVVCTQGLCPAGARCPLSTSLSS